MLWRHGRSAISAVSALTLVFELALGVGVTLAAESEDDAIRSHAAPAELRRRRGLLLSAGRAGLDSRAGQHPAGARGRALHGPSRQSRASDRRARASCGRGAIPRSGWRTTSRFLQIKSPAVTSRSTCATSTGQTLEIDTPHAAFTIERAGYYRVDVTETRSSFVTRRSGQATMTPAGGQAVAIAASEEVVLEGTSRRRCGAYAAPEPDVWDRWNYARTDQLIDAISSRYVPAGVYGVDDLDHTATGAWSRRTARSGFRSRFPRAGCPTAAVGGFSIPYYGWTWVDTAPWGWAPYHYGRWVLRERLLGLGSGTRGARPVYAPALVAFFGGPERPCGDRRSRRQLGRAGVGRAPGPMVGETAVHRPTDAVGWGGPRFVNNVVVKRTTVVNVTNINVYRNTTVQHAVVAVREESFGRGSVQQARVAQIDARRLEPARHPLRVAPDSSSYVAASGRGTRPPDRTITRSVVATRAPRREGRVRPMGTRPGRA